MKVFIKGLNSCTMRNQKLQQYIDFLEANGHVVTDNPENSDVTVVWTCAYRGDVRDNSVSEIQRYEHQYEGEVIVAGCLPDIAPELLREKFSGRVISWREDRDKMEEFFGAENVKFDDVPNVFVEKHLCDDTEKYRKENPDKDATFHDQFIKLLISEGCGFDCAYCSERLMFPPYHSFQEDVLVEACRKKVEESDKLEVILLADSLGEYGKDIGSSLPSLMRRLKTIHPDLKIALNNLNPASFFEYFDQMVDFLKNGDIRHLNLPIQSASKRMLKLMNRSYTREDIDKIFSLLNSIGFTEFDTHIIIGFPGETEDDFDESIRFILQYKPKYVLTSRYMETPEMPSAVLPDKVDLETATLRSREAVRRIKAAGIICNSDDSDLAKDRLQRINLCQ